MKYCIIGNSAAAVGCVEGIRSVDKASEITLISSEPHHTYSRPLISYLLYGKTDEQRMKYRPDGFYADNNVNAMLGRTVVSIDEENKTVVLDDKTTVAYDKLLVATGSSPLILPIEGLDSVEKKFTFMTLDDAHAFEKAIDKTSRVLIMGAGLIGLKCAEGICDKVAKITVVDLADRILPSILDNGGSEMVKSHIEKKGVEFLLKSSVTKLTENKATLSDGSELEFDVFVMCVGVRPNVSLVKDIGGNVNRGIVTDEKCRTSVDDIYAAGDCTESYDITSDTVRVLALLPNAYMQGETAGVNMAGGEKLYDKAMPMNAIGFFGLHMITAGNYDGEAIVSEEEGSRKVLFVKDNLLKGFIMIGNVERAGIYTSLIRNKTPLDTIDFELVAQKPQLMAFSKKERAAMLSK